MKKRRKPSSAISGKGKILGDIVSPAGRLGRFAMILMDTHIWLRWLLPNDPLPQNLVDLIETADALAVSAISCWEVVMLERFRRIELPLPIDQWLKEGLPWQEPPCHEAKAAAGQSRRQQPVLRSIVGNISLPLRHPAMLSETPCAFRRTAGRPGHVL